MSKFSDLLKGNRILYLDGAGGTMLQKRGLPPKTRSDIMNIIAPDKVTEVHKLYIEAGSDIVMANTFGASAHALAGSGYSPRDIIKSGIDAARRAGNALVALDIGPIGVMLEPNGDFPQDEAYAQFAEQMKLGAEFGADLIAIETMSDLAECAAAIRAARENTSLDVIVTMSFEKSGRTYLGVSPTDFAQTAESLGVAALGINCSYSPEYMMDVVAELRAATALPLILKLNAGLPDSEGGYAISPEDYAQQLLAYRKFDVKLVGACCGSDERYIKEIKKAFEV